MVQTESYCMNHVCAIWCQNWVLLNYCKVLNEVLRFAKDLRCSVTCVCGCVNCVLCFDKKSLAFKIVLKQS